MGGIGAATSFAESFLSGEFCGKLDFTGWAIKGGLADAEHLCSANQEGASPSSSAT